MAPDYRKAVEAARGLLGKNGIVAPPVDVFDVACREGLQVFLATFPNDSVSGLIDMSETRILINADEAPTRQVFTAAHELGHWMLHKDWLEQHPEKSILYRSDSFDVKDPKEKEANAFAAELLVPLEWLEEYRYLPMHQIARLFGVSPHVIGYRLARLSN